MSIPPFAPGKYKAWPDQIDMDRDQESLLMSSLPSDDQRRKAFALAMLSTSDMYAPSGE
jgi:hypothetical protein